MNILSTKSYIVNALANNGHRYEFQKILRYIGEYYDIMQLLKVNQEIRMHNQEFRTLTYLDVSYIQREVIRYLYNSKVL